MTNFKRFQSDVLYRVRSKLNDRGMKEISLKLDTINSPDGVTDRLMVSIPDSKMSMAFRLNDIYKNDLLRDGKDIDSIVESLCSTINANLSVIKEQENPIATFIKDYGQVKDSLYLRMIPGDSPILKDTPHRMIGDMAEVVAFRLDSMSDAYGKSVVTVSTPLMEMYNVDKEQLFADAEKACTKNDPINFTPMGDMKAPEHIQSMSWLLNYENAKKQLFIRVSSVERNIELIDNVPHKIVDDLVITCHIAVNASNDGIASTIVNNDLLEHYGVDAETVLNDAIENSPEILPVKIESMMNVISRTCPEAISEDMKNDPNFSDCSKMAIVSNSKMVNGASVLFYPGVMDQLSEMFGGDYVILPSSVNEFIVVPDRGNYADLENMVRDINQNMVDPQEQLSDHVYHYDSVEKLFESCKEYMARLEQNVDKDEEPDVDDDIDI
ncbi:MAG: hypothetical protein E7383_07540 [Ruminococcaceae bacterium]|nr:hypothetical protein [Oscillospiraceae bacterium]